MTAAAEDFETEDLEIPEELDFEPVSLGKPKRRRGLKLFVWTVLLLGAGAAAGWYYLEGQLDVWLAEDPGSEIPFIKAEAGPVKVRPDAPGGMEVPDRDKLVYDRLQGGQANLQVERLLPPPETPLPAPGVGGAAQSGEPSASSPSGQAAIIPSIPPSPESAPAGEEIDIEKILSPPAGNEPPPPAATESQGPSAPAVSQPAVPTTGEVIAAKVPLQAPPPPEPKGQAKAAAGGGYRVQLAAVRSPDRVEGEWTRLKRKHSDLLGKLDLSIVKADLGPEKGVFYRLRAGPIANEKDARALCAKLAERKVGCLIVRPQEK